MNDDLTAGAPAKLTHRAAAALLLLFCAGHTVGSLLGRSPAPEADVVLETMRTVRFDFHGVSRSFYELFLGHAHLVSLYLAFSALVAWTLSSLEVELWSSVAPIAWGLAVAQILSALVAWAYFFPGPAIITSLAAFCSWRATYARPVASARPFVRLFAARVGTRPSGRPMPKGALTRHPLFAFAISVFLLASAQCHAPANSSSRSLYAPADKSMPACNAAAAQAVAPPGMKIAPIDDLNPTLPFAPTGAIAVPARGYAPDYCLMTGTVVSRSSTGKTVNFGLALPHKHQWNGKLLFAGCGGLCGVVFETLPDDRRGGGFPPDALAKGYAIVATDDGHASNPPGMSLDGQWAVKESGVADDDAMIDFFYRAVHSVAVKSKEFVQSWYTGALARSYYMGCSDGGRAGMVEVTRYPTDFDGYLAGDPFLDIPGQILAGRAAQALLAAPDAFIPTSQLQFVDRAVYESCDEADGMKDGLIQNPGNCSFDPRDLLCEKHPTYGCLSEGQVNTLTAWFSAAKDEQGRVVSFGLPVSDLYNDAAEGKNLFRFAESAGVPNDRLAAEPWGDSKTEQPFAWAFLDQSFKYLISRDPAYNIRQRWAVDSRGIVSESAQALLEARTEAGRGDDAANLAPFLASGRKLILYHGYSDGFAAPFRTIRFYQSWANLVGGYDKLAEHARLFMVPGMYHCNQGPGPNFFDALGALERWVEEGRVPEEIVATKFANDDCTHATARTMPLCPFPTQAHYSGKGEVQRASSWSCSLNEDLLKMGANGAQAGLAEPVRTH